VALFAPHQPPEKGASPLTELGALKNRDVLFTLAIGAVGFGGLFAVYTYLADTLLEVTKVAESVTPLVFAVFGAGMMSGLVIVPGFAHGRLMKTAGWLLVWFAVTLAIYPLATGNLWTIMLSVFAIGLGGALGPFLGGIAIAHGFGLASTGLVGSGLALGGLAIWAAAARSQR
jgi:DHA1 family inner membrane transport protein